MKRTLPLVLAVSLLLLAGSGSLSAVSMPVVQGVAAGVELCPQSICQAAIFVAQFRGRVGRNINAMGYIAVAATHEPLPDPGESAAITGGQWELTAGRYVLGGIVDDGSLLNNGDHTYTVNATLLLLRGGIGTIYFEGILDHSEFPPTIQGTIRQNP